MLPDHSPVVLKSKPFFLYDGGVEEGLYVPSVRKRGEPERGGGKFVHWVLPSVNPVQNAQPPL
jgi:hypothetical protein